MLQADQPDTFVLATNRTETVRDFVTMAFKAVDIDIVFSGDEDQEIGTDYATGEILVRVNRNFTDQRKLIYLSGTRQKQVLYWVGNQKRVLKIMRLMVQKDLERNLKAHHIENVSYRYKWIYWKYFSELAKSEGHQIIWRRGYYRSSQCDIADT